MCLIKSGLKDNKVFLRLILCLRKFKCLYVLPLFEKVVICLIWSALKDSEMFVILIMICSKVFTCGVLGESHRFKICFGTQWNVWNVWNVWRHSLPRWNKGSFVFKHLCKYCIVLLINFECMLKLVREMCANKAIISYISFFCFALLQAKKKIN